MYFQKTINQMLADVTRDYPKRDAIVHTEHGIRGNYVWLSLEIDKVARGFLAQKIQPRDKVAIWASNVPEWLIAMLALAKIGAIMIPIDPAAEEENLNYIMQQSETRALIIAGGDDIEKVIKIVDATKKKMPAPGKNNQYIKFVQARYPPMERPDYQRPRFRRENP